MGWPEPIEKGSATSSLAPGIRYTCVSNDCSVRFSMILSSDCVTVGFVFFLVDEAKY